MKTPIPLGSDCQIRTAGFTNPAEAFSMNMGEFDMKSALSGYYNGEIRLMDDVLLNKTSIIERCLCRIREEYEACPELNNYTHLDAIILNLERACQATIDIAMHLVTKNHLGVPQNNAEAFELLNKAGIHNRFVSDKSTKKL